MDEERRAKRYVQVLRELFSSPLGQEALDLMIEHHVMVTNEEMDPILEGERSFVLNLKEIVESRPEELDEEATDDS